MLKRLLKSANLYRKCARFNEATATPPTPKQKKETFPNG